jgi:hypothetical protein
VSVNHGGMFLWGRSFAVEIAVEAGVAACCRVVVAPVRKDRVVGGAAVAGRASVDLAIAAPGRWPVIVL